MGGAKGGWRPAASAIGKLWGLGQAPDPLWALVPPFVSADWGWAISKGLPGSGISEMGMKEAQLFSLTNFQVICQVFSTRPLLVRR